MASNAYSFLVLASFAAESLGLLQIQAPLQWLKKLQDLPWLSEYLPDKLALLLMEVWSAVGIISIIIAEFYLQQWLIRYALVRPGAGSQKGVANGRKQLGRAFRQTMTHRTSNGRRAQLGRALNKTMTQRAANGRRQLGRAFNKTITHKAANGRRHWHPIHYEAFVCAFA